MTVLFRHISDYILNELDGSLCGFGNLSSAWEDAADLFNDEWWACRRAEMAGELRDSGFLKHAIIKTFRHYDRLNAGLEDDCSDNYR